MDKVSVLAHYFYPRHSNNHRAKLIHSSSFILFALFLVVYQFILNAFPIVGIKVLGYAANISTDEVIRLTNEKRSEAGVSALEYSPLLSQAAKAKGEHMLEYDYWAHTAPDGTEPWKFFTDVGYKYRYAGENLARDFSNPQSAIDAWLASPSHRDNLLSTKYKEIGIAVVEGDLGGVETTLIVQLFGTQLVDTSSQIPVAKAKPEVTPNPLATLTPTSTPVPLAALVSPQPTSFQEESFLTSLPPATEKVSSFELLISPFGSTKGISIATTVLLLVVMIIDGIVVTRRRIPRVTGRIFAHLAFLGMVLAVILIAKAGSIL